MWFDRLLQGAIDTFLMVGVSSLIALILGIPLAVILVTSGKGGIYQAPAVNQVLGGFVNLFRSIPFLILMVALIPFTRMIVGTTYGVWAAVVPLTIAATPFFARIAEVSLREVDHGLIEAAQAMGCRRWHIVWHVLLPEALPGIVGGFTITLVTMINSSAMAGAIGAGGLGDIAYRYGYQRFDSQVMLTVIVLLVILVAVIQLGGDRLAKGLNNAEWGIFDASLLKQTRHEARSPRPRPDHRHHPRPLQPGGRGLPRRHPRSRRQPEHRCAAAPYRRSGAVADSGFRLRAGA
jgi:D-methionine transport system permease protein